MRRLKGNGSLLKEILKREVLMSADKHLEDHDLTAAGTFDGIETEGTKKRSTPFVDGEEEVVFFRRNGADQRVINRKVSGVNAIVPDHLKMFVRDMTDETGDERKDGDGLGHGLIIFVTFIVKGDIVTVIGIDTGSGDGRTAQITADVFDDFVGFAGRRFGTDVKAVHFCAVEFCL